MSNEPEKDLLPLALKFAKRIEPFWQYKSKQPIGYRIPRDVSSGQKQKRSVRKNKTTGE